MYFPKLISFPALLGLLAAGALAQNCRTGSVELDVNIQCACVKDPNSQTCELYQRNKSMYDGNRQAALGYGDSGVGRGR
jgi:hypothetical protein